MFYSINQEIVNSYFNINNNRELQPYTYTYSISLSLSLCLYSDLPLFNILKEYLWLNSTITSTDLTHLGINPFLFFISLEP